MRQIHGLLAAALVLLTVDIALADVGPPVHVRILGELRAAEPGVPFVDGHRFPRDSDPARTVWRAAAA